MELTPQRRIHRAQMEALLGRHVSDDELLTDVIAEAISVLSLKVTDLEADRARD